MFTKSDFLIAFFQMKIFSERIATEDNSEQLYAFN